MTNTSSMISFESNYMLLKCRPIINLYMSICLETFLLYKMRCVTGKLIFRFPIRFDLSMEKGQEL